jgi:hypothetical protein
MLDMRIPVASVSRYPEHVREFIDRYAYLDLRDTAMLVLESDEGRFMNHADKPNLDFKGATEGFALVDIPAGTELTCDYREFEETLVFQPPRHKGHDAANDRAA